jgi:hypothetical protein
VKLDRRIALMFAFTGALAGAGVAFNYLVNPYGAWGPRLIDPVFRKIDQERVATPYLLRSQRPDTVLLGSSRVLMGMRIEQGCRDGFLNAALSAATVPQLAAELDVALTNPSLKRIVWGVDFFAFNANWHPSDPNFESRINGSREELVTDTLLSLTEFEDGYDFVRSWMRGARRLPAEARAAVPWSMDFICDRLNAPDRRGLQTTGAAEIETELAQDLPDYASYRFGPATMELFRSAIERARARGVEVVLFVPPMSRYELELIRQTGRWDAFQDFKRKLATVGPFWDFSGYNDLSHIDASFMHVMHFKTAVGYLMLRIMLGDHDPRHCSPTVDVVRRAAMRVDGGSIGSVLALQDQRMRESMESESQYSKIAAAALARRSRDRGVLASGS